MVIMCGFPVCCRAMPLADDVDLAGLAASSQGFTGAELAGLCRWDESASVGFVVWSSRAALFLLV
jgi:ATP-dependent 26S proteasome regulatory subunit